MDGHRSGHGFCITAEGTYYEGNFADNESLSGNSIAYFSNGSYYVGELSIRGPNGRGTLYLPAEPVHHIDNMSLMDNQTQSLTIRGSILSGSLGGNWDNVKINHGNVLMNQTFDKFPNQSGGDGGATAGGKQSIDLCQTKWESLFLNWEHDVFDCTIIEITDTKILWRKIIKYIDSVKQIESLKSTIATSEMIYKSDNNEANKISIGGGGGGDGGGHHATIMAAQNKPLFLYESQQKSNTTVPKSMSLSRITGRNYKHNLFSSIERNKSISNEFLNNAIINANGDGVGVGVDVDVDFDGVNETQEFTTTLSTTPFTCVPHFGITKLDSKDLRMLRDYLMHAFKNPYHPLGILNSRISECFYTSYGCWKVKPISIISKHAMQEWESISQRIYEILRCLFPTLPLDYGTLDE